MTAVELERIYPNAERWEVQQRLFGGLGKEEVKRLIEAGELETLLKKAVRGFASRAFRRPVDDAVVARYVALGMAEIDKGKRPKEGLRAAYRAVLCSPRFLTLVEVPGRLDAHAVASRLSYFLWASMPNSVARCWTNISNSSKEPSSRSTSSRSRAVSLPFACCASIRL